MKEASLYFSDLHLGASQRNLDLVKSSFDALTPFFRENYLHITRAVDLGDSTENWLTAKEFGNPYQSREVIEATRNVYRNIFNGRKPVLAATAGNHQTKILNSQCSPEEAMNSTREANSDLAVFLAEVFDDFPEAEVSVFQGIRQTAKRVFAHHGDYLNVETEIRKALAEIQDEMTAEQKMAVINEKAEVYEAMQKKVWQKFQKNLWPALKNIPHFAELAFPPYVAMTRLKALVREKSTGCGAGTIGESWKNPVFDETLLQFELLRALTDEPQNSAIISGHFHVPGLVTGRADHPGTVVALGAWHDSHLKPTVAIHTQAESRNRLLLSEFDMLTNRWNVRDEAVF